MQKNLKSDIPYATIDFIFKNHKVDDFINKLAIKVINTIIIF